MQRVIAHEAGTLGGKRRFANGRFEAARQRVPIEVKGSVGLAAAKLHGEALHRHHQFQRLHPLRGDQQGILAREIVELGLVVAANRGDPAFLARACRVGGRQRDQAALSFRMEVAVIGVEPVLVAFRPAAQAFHERRGHPLQPRRQGGCCTASRDSPAAASSRASAGSSA